MTEEKRSGLRLDKDTWDAIDWIAKHEGRKWSKWAKEVMERNPDSNNITAEIRAEAMRRILKELVSVENNLERSKQLEQLAKEILGGRK